MKSRQQCKWNNESFAGKHDGCHKEIGKNPDKNTWNMIPFIESSEVGKANLYWLGRHT